MQTSRLKTLLIILVLGFSYPIFGQSVNKNFVGLQFGGQALVGLSYDRTLINRDKITINGATGLVLNEYADDQDPTDQPIYGLNLGVIGLFDLKYVFFEAGMYASPYFYKSLTFITYYSWVGLRLFSRKNEGAYISAGWTPSLYFSKSPPNHYNHVPIGVKIGVTF
jgi:hypothetical protein